MSRRFKGFPPSGASQSPKAVIEPRSSTSLYSNAVRRPLSSSSFSVQFVVSEAEHVLVVHLKKVRKGTRARQPPLGSTELGLMSIRY